MLEIPRCRKNMRIMCEFYKLIRYFEMILINVIRVFEFSEGRASDRTDCYEQWVLFDWTTINFWNSWELEGNEEWIRLLIKTICFVFFERHLYYIAAIVCSTVWCRGDDLGWGRSFLLATSKLNRKSWLEMENELIKDRILRQCSGRLSFDSFVSLSDLLSCILVFEYQESIH